MRMLILMFLMAFMLDAEADHIKKRNFVMVHSVEWVKVENDCCERGYELEPRVVQHGLATPDWVMSYLSRGWEIEYDWLEPMTCSELREFEEAIWRRYACEDDCGEYDLPQVNGETMGPEHMVPEDRLNYWRVHNALMAQACSC